MRVGVLTSGGDAPGMNAAVWHLARGAAERGWTTVGVRHGFEGLAAREAAVVDPAEAGRRARYGGTWLGTSRFADLPSHLDTLASAMEAMALDALVILGGNGSLAAARLLADTANRPVVAIAATIDNDVAVTDLSLGFDTAVGTALEMADRLRDTAESLPRFFALETLGGPTGHIAAAVGRLAGACATLIPERPVDHDGAVAGAKRALAAGEPAIVVASEGVPDLSATLERIAEGADMRLRAVRLGHAQRGGPPSARDRAAALAFSGVALNAIAERRSGIAALRQGALSLVPFSEHRDAPPPDPLSFRGLL